MELIMYLELDENQKLSSRINGLTYSDADEKTFYHNVTGVRRGDRSDCDLKRSSAVEIDILCE